VVTTTAWSAQVGKSSGCPKAAVAFPEVDRPAWFDLDAGRSKILLSQTKLLDRFDKGLA
jgi:predicted NUDIX family NTP pyrophosphohydrolase